MTRVQSRRCFALVPCAGVGTRASAGTPKQYVRIAGRAMVAHTLRALARVSRLTATLVVLPPLDNQFESQVPDFTGEHAWFARCGGAMRAQTVANGLAELVARGVQADDWILVHDAVRCLIHPQWVDRLIDACWDDDIGGLLALPVTDTLKHERAGRVQTTLDRAGKWVAQTPQMFQLGMLSEALARAGTGVTDEASAVEALGHAPKLVPGAHENLKVTWPADFEFAARLLHND